MTKLEQRIDEFCKSTGALVYVGKRDGSWFAGIKNSGVYEEEYDGGTAIQALDSVIGKYEVRLRERVAMSHRYEEQLARLRSLSERNQGESNDKR